MKTNKLLFLLLLLPFLSFGQVSNYPDKSDFENGLGSWVNPGGDDFDWTWKLGSGTPSSGTGPQTFPYGADNSDGYIFTESSGANQNSQAWLECRYDMSSLSDATLQFSYHNYSANGGGYGPGRISLDIFDGSSWTYGIWNSSTSFNGWQDAVVDLSAYAGRSLVILSFTGLTTGYQSDMCLDDLLVDGTGGGGGGGPPACATLDYEQDFETGITSMTATTNSQSQAGIDAISANGSLYGLHLQGNTSTGWSSSYSTGELAFTTSPTHIASVSRAICASTASGLTLTFDKLQTYTYRETYSWFRLTVGGVAIPDVNGRIYHSAMQGNACGAWEPMQYDLTPYIGGEFTVAWEGCNKYYNGYTTTGCGGDNVFIDNILIAESTTTPPPSTPSSITGQSTPNGGASLTYSVVNVSTVDTYTWTFPSGWIIASGQGSSSITVTTGTTSGNVSVTATNTSGTSAASTLAVVPVAVVTSFPYSSDFESEIQHSTTASATGFTFAATGWRNVDGDDGDWRADRGGTGSQLTGPGDGTGSGQPDHNPGTSSGYYLYVESSTPNFPSKNFIIWSPPYNLTSMTTPTLTFWYSLYSATNATLALQYSLDNGTTFEPVNLPFMCTTDYPLAVIYDNMGTSWRQGLVDLSSLQSSTNIMFRFIVQTGTSFDGDVCIDDIKLNDAATSAVDVGENITLGSSAYDNAYELILNGSSAQTITPAGYSVENITINNTNGVTVNGSNLVVDGTLTLTDGVIATGSNSVIVTSTSAAAVSGGSSTSFINGTLRRHFSANTDTYAFPIGQGAGPTNYFRADLINNNMNLPGNTDFVQMSVAVEAETGNNLDANLIATHNGTSITNIFENSIWTVSPSMGGTFLSGNYGVNLYVGNLLGLTDNWFTVLKRSSTSTSYIDWSTHDQTTLVPASGQPGRTVAGGYAQRTGFTEFSKFGAGQGSDELPIELLYFRAKVISNEHVRLEWETLSESNNERFDIERSEDGNSWHFIGYVDGNGTTNESLKYSYDDRFPLNGISYYRFRQIDFDGAWAYSNIAVVKLMGEDEEPIYIFDVIGRVIWTGVDYLPDGIYFFQYEDGRTEKVLINKKLN